MDPRDRKLLELAGWKDIPHLDAYLPPGKDTFGDTVCYRKLILSENQPIAEQVADALVSKQIIDNYKVMTCFGGEGENVEYWAGESGCLANTPYATRAKAITEWLYDTLRKVL